MKDDFKFSEHVDRYPPVIPRAKVSLYFPWLSQKRLANLDLVGQGPDHSFKNGRAVLYPTWAFLVWLDERTQRQGKQKIEPHQAEHTTINKRRGRKSKAQEIRERRG